MGYCYLLLSLLFFFCMTHLSMEVNAVCGLLVPKSSTSFSYSVQLDLKAHTADYVLTSWQRSTSSMSSLSSRSSTSSESDDSSKCTVKGTSAVLQSSQSTSKHSHSLRIHCVTTKRHADCWSMERYLMGGPSTILKQSKFNPDHSKKYEYRCCICGCEFRLLLLLTIVMVAFMKQGRVLFLNLMTL